MHRQARVYHTLLLGDGSEQDEAPPLAGGEVARASIFIVRMVPGMPNRVVSDKPTVKHGAAENNKYNYLLT